MSYVWERQPTETDEAWKAFKCYRDQAHRNPYKIHVDNIMISKEQAHKYYNEYNWKDRAFEYDRHFDAISLEARAESLRQIEKDGLPNTRINLDRLQAIAEREITKLEDASYNSGPMLKPLESLKFIEAAIKLRALIEGQPTEIHGTSEVDFSKLTVEELRKWRELRDKAKKTG